MASFTMPEFYVPHPARMNPHLEYAQAIHGRTKGRGIGTVRRGFPLAADVLLRLSLLRQAEESTKLTRPLSTERTRYGCGLEGGFRP